MCVDGLVVAVLAAVIGAGYFGKHGWSSAVNKTNRYELQLQIFLNDLYVLFYQ